MTEEQNQSLPRDEITHRQQEGADKWRTGRRIRQLDGTIALIKAMPPERWNDLPGSKTQDPSGKVVRVTQNEAIVAIQKEQAELRKKLDGAPGKL
jgi:hypothetical protein